MNAMVIRPKFTCRNSLLRRLEMCLTGIVSTEATFWSGDLVELRRGLIGQGDYFENGFLGLKINMHFGPGFRGGNTI